MSKSVMCLMVIAAMFLAADVPRGEAAIGCDVVFNKYLSLCFPYVTGNRPLGGCCGGIKGLYGVAKTTSDRQSVCSCLKNLATSFPSSVVSKAAGLPRRCGVSISYKISLSTDCTKVK